MSIVTNNNCFIDLWQLECYCRSHNNLQVEDPQRISSHHQCCTSSSHFSQMVKCRATNSIQCYSYFHLKNTENAETNLWITTSVLNNVDSVLLITQRKLQLVHFLPFCQLQTPLVNVWTLQHTCMLQPAKTHLHTCVYKHIMYANRPVSSFPTQD